MPRMVIAGSSRGIGAAVARLARAEGWEVILHGRNRSASLMELSEELGSPAIACDGIDRTAVHRALADAGALDGIDSLVNSLGAVTASSILDDTDDLWTGQYAANVLAPLHFCQELIPAMIRTGSGTVVNVSSIRGYSTLSEPEVAAYSAAKSALINLTAGLARAYAPAVRVNCVAPGFTLTDMSHTWSDRVRSTVQTALLGRAAEPEEIAQSIMFLATPRSSFITGQTLLVDGGLELASS